MAFFSFFSRKPNQPKPLRRASRLGFDTLEERATPAGNISGYVYNDVNNNGIFDAGETPLNNVALQLKSNTTNQIVATTTSDANGFYQFLYDNTIQTTPTSISKTLAFPATDTNFNLTGTVDQFDPSLGQLTSIDIIHDGSITSTLLVENTSKSSGSTINGTVSGNLNLIAPGVNDTLTLSQNAGSVTVGVFDGVADFNGSSGASLGSKTANGSKTTVVDSSSLSAWQGTGKVTIQEIGAATSNASGGGNVNTAITSTGRSTITVRYNYIPTKTLQPGPYTITETQPNGYLDGKDSIGNVPIADSIGKDIIVLTLSDTPLTNNNFGELLASSISGYVYHDANNNALKEGNETPIGGVTIALSGSNDLGQPVSQTATTDGTGFYSFPNLRPGTYTVSETQPATYLDGKETTGTVAQSVQGYIAGNTATNDQIASIVLPGAANSVSNNFGELQNSSISGYVYVDANNNGVKDGNETPISGDVVTLTGFTADGPVSLTATTDGSGFYQFTNLKPGTYGLQEGNPGSQYLDGKDTIGSQGGTVGNDNFSNIALGSGVSGVNNNFGELLPASVAGLVYADVNKNGVFDSGDTPIPNTTVTLTGSDDVGSTNRTTTTSASGNYSFTNLRPGSYTITETQPANYNDGSETNGSLGGNVGNDVFSGIVVAMGAAGTGYNFGELVQDDADVGIVKTASAASVNVGDTLTYTLTVTNYGAYTAKGLTVTDTLPPGAVYVSASGSGWAVTQANGVITATMPSLAVGASTVITVQIKVPAVSATLTNTAVVTTTTTDKNPNNNTSTVTTPVNVPGTSLNAIVGVPYGVAGKNQFLSSTYAQFLTDGKSAAIVNGLFQTVLERIPDTAGLNHFVDLMRSGTSAAQVTTLLWNSDEHRTLQANQTYQAVLGRAPSDAERQSAINSLKAGSNEATLARGLYTSAEYQNTHGNSANLVGSLYLSVTGSLPTAAQSASTLSTLANSPLDQVVASIQQSDDGLRSVIRAAYREVLRRNASEAEVNSWLTQMKYNGVTQDSLYFTFLNSDEFKTLALNAMKK